MKITKRGLVRGAAAAFASGGFPSAISRALAMPAMGGTKSIQDVEHVVILMQENRSFDHYFGTLNGVRGFGDRITPPLAGGQRIWQQPDGAGGSIMPFALNAATSDAQHVTSLPHGWADGHEAWNQGRMDGWIQAKGKMTMAHFSQADIPFHFALANAFTLCDAYFAAMPSSTNPNRTHLLTGMVDPHGQHGGPMFQQPIENRKTFLLPEGPRYSWTTYPERLLQAGVSWRIYQGLDEDGPFKIDAQDRVRRADDPDPSDPEAIVSCFNPLRFFKQYANAPVGSALYEQAMTRRTPRSFAADVQAGTLPQVSWLMPPLNCSEHPRWSPADGANYIATILDALTANPDIWGKTAFFIVYDENDGYFDHVLPPSPPASEAEGLSNIPVTDDIHTDGLPFGLGFRVPAFVISPWSKGGVVCSQVFDHTSVIRFLETRFGVMEPNISPWRRAICGDMTSAFDFSASNPARPMLPRTSAYTTMAARQAALPPPEPPAAFVMPVQQRGQRAARPLPYRLAVRCLPSTDGVTLEFENQGTAGAVFYVFGPAGAPKRYSLAAHSILSDAINLSASGGYDVQVFGPNGFLRHFTGNGAGHGIAVRHAAFRQEVIINVSNPQDGPGDLSIVDNAYGAPKLTMALPTEKPLSLTWHTASSHGWYDITIATGAATQRAAGHVETGAASMTDPAFG